MALLSKIFDFIKGLLTRPGLHTFLKKYQSVALLVIEDMADSREGEGFNEWWDDAFAELKARIAANSAVSIPDNWLAIALNLAYEIFKADKKEPAEPYTPPLPPPPPKISLDL